jgi:hypothetical protein
MSKAPKRVNTRKAPSANTQRPRWTEDQASAPAPRAHAGATEPETPEPVQEAPRDASEPPKGTRRSYWLSRKEP